MQEKEVHSTGGTKRFLDSIVIFDPRGKEVCEVPFKDLKTLHYNKSARELIIRTKEATVKYSTTG